MTKDQKLQIGALFSITLAIMLAAFLTSSGTAFDPLVAQGTTNFDDLVVDSLDVAGGLFDLDADNDTSITADTDDQIDFEIGGADEFQMTAGQFTVGDASAGDDAIVFDGNAQDFYIALDDGTDDLYIGLGAAVGTTTILTADENQDFTFTQRGVISGVEAADSGTTNETLEVAFSSPVDTTGTNTHNAITIDLTIGNATGGTNNVRGLQIDGITDDPQVVETAINVGDEWDAAINTGLPIIGTAQTWWDDFLGDIVKPEYTETSGTDAEAVQALVEEQFGVYQLTSGDAGVNTAGDAEQVSLSLNWQADQGGLVFEARLHLDTAITTVELCVGLTDTVALELPFTNASDTITSVASDAVAFCFDTNATTDEWWALGVAGDTDATGNGATGTAPVADTYQTLRIEIDDGGADCRFYIDGTLAGTLTANCVTPTVALAPFVTISSAQTATSHVVDVDYIFVSAARD